MLIFKRNELKRNIRNITVNGVNNNAKHKFKLGNKKESNINNDQINNINNINNINEENKVNEEKQENMENELENDAEFNEPNINDNNNIEDEDGQQKLKMII